MSIELINLKGGTGYFPLKYTNVGLYTFKKHGVLIDSGADDEDGKLICDYLDSKGINLEAIIITHAHADNLGGTFYIKNNTKAKLLTTKEEALVVENPKRSNYSCIIQEKKETEEIINGKIEKKTIIQNTVLTHKKCLVDLRIEPNKAYLTPSFKHKFDIVDLAGHSIGQIGIITPDKVFFIADSVYSIKELEQNPIPYSADITKFKKSLELLLYSKNTLFVPTHGKHIEFSITSEVYNNQRQIKMVEENILMHSTSPKTTDELVALVLSSFGIEETVPNFYLVTSTINAYLQDLKASNKIKAILERGKTRWFNDNI
jgi:glyoxylase-like metal-dependent hydrolase (beta-lactamase superfamily II)